MAPCVSKLIRLAGGLLLVLALACPFSVQAQEALPTSPLKDYRVFAFNDLGMHCYDNDFSVFCLLPLFNVIHAQPIQKGVTPRFLNDADITVSYSAYPSTRYDSNGNPIDYNSITTTSRNKTNFWTFIAALFGPAFKNWPVDQGILGVKMPSAANGPQPLSTYSSLNASFPAYKWFSATGIPLTNIDDRGNINCFPMMRITAQDKNTGFPAASLDIVLPASSEMNCVSCHETADFVPSNPGSASDASPPPRLTTLQPTDFSYNADPNIRFRENILILHDAFNPGLNLFARYKAGQPTLCAQCHYSKALDLAGNNRPTGDQVGHLFLSRAMHKHHGTKWPMMDGTYSVPIPLTGVQQCYYCHPGNDTQCLRSVMAVKGMQCQNCHGELLQVAGFTPQLGQDGFVDPYLPDVADQAALRVNLTTTGAQRLPWVDMPKCQSCHSGDALNHLGQNIIGTLAYDPQDPAATPLIATNLRFAENADTVFRFSQTHGGVACESCHGSPHAEWPAHINTNDNKTAVEIQGHTGEISECSACHYQLPAGLGGPHGLHNVNDPGWMAGHGAFFRAQRNSCKACHGRNLKGTSLSRAKADRTLLSKTGALIPFARGTEISCLACHTGAWNFPVASFLLLD